MYVNGEVQLTGRSLEIRDPQSLTFTIVPAGGTLSSGVLDFSGVSDIAVATYLGSSHSHQITINLYSKDGATTPANISLFSGTAGNQMVTKSGFAWAKASLFYKNNDVGAQNCTFFAYGRK